MVSGAPSRTILRPAIGRAAHQLLDRPLIFTDTVAVGLVPEASEAAILAAVEEHRALHSGLFRAAVALRARFAEDRLAAAAQRGVRQYLMLGAGLETFPWRQPDFARRMHLVLADQPASLAWSRERFAARRLLAPENLTFAAADLEGGDFAGALAQAGVDMRAPTFVSALGVVHYLGTDAVEALFGFVGKLPPGSEIVFTFPVPEDELADDEREEVRVTVARTAAMGEPWRTRVPASEMVSRLHRAGVKDVFHLTPELAQERYFAGRRDGLRAQRREQLIAAIV
jgi:methyltransferase (TIGR00027 family)